MTFTSTHDLPSSFDSYLQSQPASTEQAEQTYYFDYGSEDRYNSMDMFCTEDEARKTCKRLFDKHGWARCEDEFSNLIVEH